MPHIKDPIFGKEAKDTAKRWNFALPPGSRPARGRDMLGRCSRSC